MAENSTPDPPFGLDQFMAASVFGMRGMPIGVIAEEHPDLVAVLRTFDGLKVAATFGSFLTIPELQSNCVRLETMIHLAIALGSGKRSPTAKHSSQWFEIMGKGSCGRMEDPAEDVFAGSISSPRGNFRVLEGIWESATFYLQRIVNVVEGMPQYGPLAQLRESVYALLALSDALCERAGLTRNQLGNPIPEALIPLKYANTTNTLRRRISFSQTDLDNLGIALPSLHSFVFDPGNRSRLLSEAVGHTLLERFPLVYKGDRLIFILPTAVSAAIRRLVLEQVDSLGARESFMTALEDEYSSLMWSTPLLGDLSHVPIRFQQIEGGRFAAAMIKADEGHYLNFIFFLDTLEDFATYGLNGCNPDPEGHGTALNRLIDRAHDDAVTEADFREGLSIVIGCGIGRATVVDFGQEQPASWRREFLSAADLLSLSWLPNNSPLYLWKLLEAQDKLNGLGVSLQNINGLINLVAWVRSQHGHLVPHKDVPDEFGSGDMPSFIVIEQNALLGLRHEAATSWDAHMVRNVQDEWVGVRKPQQSDFQEDLERPLYMSEAVAAGRSPAGVYLTATRSWWFEVEFAEGISGHMRFQRWQMIGVWISRIAPVLEQHLGGLPEGALLWRMKFESDLDEFDTDIEPISYDDATSTITVSADGPGRTISVTASSEFEAANFNVRNVAERALVAQTIKGFALLAGRTLSEAEHAAIIAAIVPGDQARQMHMFRARSFRDYARVSLPRHPTPIDAIDGGALKLGLGWRVRDRGLGRDISGKQECTAFLNSVVTLMEDELCAELRMFDREALITAALADHESAAADRDIWMRTSSAVLALHNDKLAAMNTIALHEYKLNAIFQSTRLLIEFALCECPPEGGWKPGKSDLSRFMATVALLTGYGGWSDAMRWEAMEPFVRIQPLGDIYTKVGDFEEIMEDYGRAGSDVRIKDAIENYAQNLEEIEVRRTSEDAFDTQFLVAWQEEFGASIDAVRKFVDAVENIGIATGSAILHLKKSQLLSLTLDGKALPAEATSILVEAFTFRSRPRWRDVPNGYDEKDRQSWRFRRRLTILRRPIIQIDDMDDPAVLVAPSVLRTAFSYMLGGYYKGDFPNWQLKPGMLAWSGRSSDRRGKAFTKEVADRLTELDWKVEREILVTKLLGRSFGRNYGDVDVLAWNTEQARVLIIECKDVQYRKTYGEVAEQLADFRGQTNSEGKPDHLLRHLDRVDLISSHLDSVKKYLKLTTSPKIESHLVFKNPVPMQFALKQMRQRVAVHVYADLAQI